MIKFNHVTKSFDGVRSVLNDVNFFVERGEFVFLIGHTGAGKTTLFKHIYMEEFPTQGQVIVAGYNSNTIRKKEIPYLRRKIGIVFQDFKLLKDRNVFENVALTLQVADNRKKNIKKRVFHLLSEMGLSHQRNEFPQTLSGGEQQRVSIARALAADPYILLADEPTGNLDLAVAFDILELLKQVNAGGTTILMATHNPELIKNAHSRILEIKQGTIIR